jgi:hypothetical protein
LVTERFVRVRLAIDRLNGRRAKLKEKVRDLRRASN